ncbi:MAG: c-type cytochrome domain-containing protein [Bryobacteraceae bacterium]
MIRPLLAFVALAGLAAAADAPRWTAEIAPLIDKRCGGCHGGEAKMGEYSVNTYATVMSGGNHGRPVVAGNPDESLLYQMVIGKAYPRMPMDGTILADAEAAMLRRWIEAGARGPEAGESPPAVRTAPAPLVKPRTATKQIFALAWQPAGTLLAAAGHETVTLIDAASRKTVATLDGFHEPVRAVTFSADGRRVAAAGGECGKRGEARIWDVASRAVTATISGHSDCIYGLAISPDGRILATSSYDKLIKLWDSASGQEMRTLKDHIDAVYALAFTPDGRRLVSGSADRTVKVWNVADGRRLYTFSEATDGINTVAVDPSGRLVAAGGLDKSVRIWRMDETGGEMTLSMMAHQDAILRIAWSPDGSLVATSSADRTVKTLKAADLSEVASVGGQSDWAYGLEFSPDGKRMAIGRMDGSLDVVETAPPGGGKGVKK